MTFNWGTGIAAAYTLFALATLGFVTFAMGQPVSLVSASYYEDALQQDATAAATARADALGSELTVDVDQGRAIRIALPPAQAATASGRVVLYRAADADADRELPLALAADGTMTVPVDGLVRGAWTVKLRWESGGLAYYRETPVMLR